MTTSNTYATVVEEKLQTLEQHLNQLQEQLIRAQRLAAIGTMAGMIAHEFNNLLTPIVSYAQFALTQDDPELMRKALTRAYQNGEKTVQVAQQMLGFARGDDDADHADVAEVIDQALKALVRDLAKDNIELTLDVAPTVVSASPKLLQQVLYNLILNARQAMLGKPGRLTIRSTNDDGHVRIDVADTGQGIDPQTLPRIFDPFFTTKSNDDDMQGTGLGLAISKHIIEQAGGTLTVQSTVGQGTCFTIALSLNSKQPTTND